MDNKIQWHYQINHIYFDWAQNSKSLTNLVKKYPEQISVFEHFRLYKLNLFKQNFTPVALLVIACRLNIQA